MPRKSVMIIKHGYSETCDHHVSPIVSFGDVFRCTCLLEDCKGYHVTWITAPDAFDLLTKNHLIDRLILAETPEALPENVGDIPYDIVINLEKQRDWCEFATRLNAQQKYGFKDWSGTGNDCFYPESAAALSKGLERDGFHALQQTLFETIGRQWHGQRYVLGYQPRVQEIYDIGLNYHVGPKWPAKAWPLEHWKQLDGYLGGYAVSWQQSLNSVRHYIDWLAACRMIITTDSLGLHLALGLRKKVIALFGPTSAEQVYMYNCGTKITPLCDRPCMPCFQKKCAYDECCMSHISVEQVLQTVHELMPARSLLPIPDPATLSV